MQICATLVCNTKNSDEQSIICVNYVLRYIADYHTNHHNHNHNRHHNCKNPNHRHDINHHLNINFVLSGSQYSSVVMASEQVRISIFFSTYDNEKEANLFTKSWGNYINHRAGGRIIINNFLSGGPTSDADKERPQRRRPCWDQEWVA